MLSLKTNGLDKHAKGMSLHLGYFDTASFYSIYIIYIKYIVKLLIVKGGQDHFPFRRTRYHENFPLIS